MRVAPGLLILLASAMWPGFLRAQNADTDVHPELRSPNYRITHIEGIGYDAKLARQDPSNVTGDGLVFPSGHTVCVWPHRGGIAALVDHAGPERYPVQWASEGTDFARAARIPHAHTGCGPYDPEPFTGVPYARGISWGVAQFNANGTLCLVRFDVDLAAPPQESEKH